MTEAQTLLAIENFMKRVIKPNYYWRDFEEDFDELLHDADAIYNPSYQYAPLVQAYFDLLPERLKCREYKLFDSCHEFGEYQFDLEDQHKDSICSLRQKNKRNQKNLEKYFLKLIQCHCKLLLVRVDLHYSTDVCPSIKQFDQDIKKLVKRIQDKDTIFNGQVGYAYRLEQGGKSRGYHCHLLVIYNGSKRYRDSHLAQEIGTLWQDRITSGDGAYYICNTAKNKREYQQAGRLGIGMIERGDARAEYNALMAIGYLATPEKDNQYLRGKLSGMREFGKGQVKKDQRRRRSRSQKIIAIHH